MKLIIWTYFVLSQVRIALGQTSLEEISLNNGNLYVGFQHYLTSDSTRTYKRIYDWSNKSIPRPISVSIWYPSNEKPKNAEPMKVIDYMQIPKSSEQGINVLLLATHIYPNSANLFDSLAEAYLIVGDKTKAIKNFEKSLKFDAQNQNAIDRLKQLNSKSPNR